jgi:hypothetical protein
MRRLPRAEMVLPVAILAAAIMLGVSEFMVTFQFTPPGGEALREQVASDRHSFALLMLALFALAATLFAIATGLRAAALAAAVFGGAALLLFLVLDLPDAGKLGDLEDPVFGLANARAEPQTGFWLEAVGSVVLALSTGALATLSSDQLRAPAVWLSERRRRRDRSGAGDGDSPPAGGGPVDEVNAKQGPVSSRRVARRAKVSRDRG